MRDTMDYVINFDFEEVNSAVFRNAQLYLRKKVKSDKVCVIVPAQFAFLFKNADAVAVLGRKLLKEFGIGEYREVLNYGCSSDTAPAGRVRRKIQYTLRRIQNAIIDKSKLFGDKVSIFVYGKLYYSGRQRKFFIDNGLEKYCLKSLARRYGQFKYVRVADYFDFTRMKIADLDLYKHFSLNFSYLETMIKEGDLYSNRMNKQKLSDAAVAQLPLLSEAQKRFLSDFVSAGTEKVILRTRNFPNKATAHNSSPEVFCGLAKALVFRKVRVLNLGCPLLELDIQSELYCEIDHNLPFELELALCQCADAAAMTGGAGLFTAFAASRIRIIQVDDEWSELLSPPIRLLTARAAAGQKDMDIRKYAAAEDFEGAADQVLGCIKTFSSASGFAPERAGAPVQAAIEL